jgi:hypothetical protein
MPSLAHSLHDRDLGFLKLIAEHWGFDLRAPDARSALPELIHALTEAEHVQEVVEALPAEAHQALARLQRSQGRLPWTDFTRSFGAVREMGAARRDRERPDLAPVSAAEMLWYRALLGRGFFDTPRGPREFAFIPDDLVGLLSPPQYGPLDPPGIPADPADSACPLPATDAILDQACTLLAALRLKLDPQVYTVQAVDSIPTSILTALLGCAGLLDPQSGPRPEQTREFLEAPRAEALAWLARAWAASPDFNELRLLPGLRCEGEWTNDALHARGVILDQLAHTPAGGWWNLHSFITAIHDRQPDYQRPAGDYDSWFIRQEASGEYLRGFEHWDEVDGALVRFVLTGPLHWLGILELASREPHDPACAFRRTAWADDLLQSKPPKGLAPETSSLQIQRDGKLSVPALFPRAARYQIARCAVWEGTDRHGYLYRLTPASLERAREQGLRASALIHLLRKHASAPPQPALVQALERWEMNGAQARLEPLLILRVSSPEVLAELRRSRAGRFLGDPLGTTAVIVPASARERVLAALAEMGYLAEAGFNDRADV